MNKITEQTLDISAKYLIPQINYDKKVLQKKLENLQSIQERKKSKITKYAPKLTQPGIMNVQLNTALIKKEKIKKEKKRKEKKRKQKRRNNNDNDNDDDFGDINMNLQIDDDVNVNNILNEKRSFS